MTQTSSCKISRVESDLRWQSRRRISSVGCSSSSSPSEPWASSGEPRGRSAHISSVGWDCSSPCLKRLPISRQPFLNQLAMHCWTWRRPSHAPGLCWNLVAIVARSIWLAFLLFIYLFSIFPYKIIFKNMLKKFIWSFLFFLWKRFKLWNQDFLSSFLF